MILGKKLYKCYGAMSVAVDDFCFDIKPVTSSGLLGPNRRG